MDGRRRRRGSGGAGFRGWSELLVALLLVGLCVPLTAIVGASGAVVVSRGVSRVVVAGRVAARTSTPSAGLSAATAPAPCTVTPNWGGPNNTLSVNSWCIPSITGINGYVGQSLGVYRLHLSQREEQRHDFDPWLGPLGHRPALPRLQSRARRRRVQGGCPAGFLCADNRVELRSLMRRVARWCSIPFRGTHIRGGEERTGGSGSSAITARVRRTP